MTGRKPVSLGEDGFGRLREKLIREIEKAVANTLGQYGVTHIEGMPRPEARAMLFEYCTETLMLDGDIWPFIDPELNLPAIGNECSISEFVEWTIARQQAIALYGMAETG